MEVARDIVRSHGKELSGEACAAAVGRRPLEAWAAVADQLQLPASPEELVAASEPLLRDRWHMVSVEGGGRGGRA